MARSERVCIHFQCAPSNVDGEESNVRQLSGRRGSDSIGSDMTSMESDCLSQSTVRDEVARCGSVDEPTALTSAKLPEVVVGVPRA